MSKVQDLLTYLRAQLGKPYVYGDEGPGTFDCSGLVQYVYGLVGLGVPRTSQQQQAATTKVSKPLPGDLVFYGQPAYHVGIYIGNQQMIDAPDVGKNVRIDQVGNPTGYGRVKGLGTVSAAGVDAVARLTATTGSSPTGLRSVVLTVLYTGLGLLLAVGLIGLGGYRAFTTTRR